MGEAFSSQKTALRVKKANRGAREDRKGFIEAGQADAARMHHGEQPNNKAIEHG
jgi:hypothetical protein